MGQKINPDSFRLGYIENWDSKWFYKKSRKYFLQEDCLIRDCLNDELENAGVDSIKIERNRDDVKIAIKSNKPGLIIGRKGTRIRELKEILEKEIKELRKENDVDTNFGLNLNVIEMGRNELSAGVIAEQIVNDIERRIHFRRTLKRQMGSVQKNRDIEGARLQVSGRLNGAEFSRTEWMDYGKMPLNTLRANVDFAEKTAYTTYGTIGIKVWLYKGKVFEREDEEEGNN